MRCINIYDQGVVFEGCHPINTMRVLYLTHMGQTPDPGQPGGEMTTMMMEGIIIAHNVTICPHTTINGEEHLLNQ